MPPIIGVSFDLKELWYRLVILAAGVCNVVFDNWLMILLIVLVCIAVHFITRAIAVRRKRKD